MIPYAVNWPCVRGKNVVSLDAYRNRRQMLSECSDIDRLCREADAALAEWRKEKGK